MRPLRATDLASASPVERGPGRRLPQTLMLIDQRDELLVLASEFFPGLSHRETARQLHSKLSNFRAGRWRRDRSEASCPDRLRGKLDGLLWAVLRVHDAIPSTRTIRRALGGR